MGFTGVHCPLIQLNLAFDTIQADWPRDPSCACLPFTGCRQQLISTNGNGPALGSDTRAWTRWWRLADVGAALVRRVTAAPPMDVCDASIEKSRHHSFRLRSTRRHGCRPPTLPDAARPLTLRQRVRVDGLATVAESSECRRARLQHGGGREHEREGGGASARIRAAR